MEFQRIINKLLQIFEKKKKNAVLLENDTALSSEFKVLKGQESYKIKPLANSNVWGQFNNGQSIFKKGDLIDCHTTFGINFF